MKKSGCPSLLKSFKKEVSEAGMVLLFDRVSPSFFFFDNFAYRIWISLIFLFFFFAFSLTLFFQILLFLCFFFATH